MLGRPGAQQGEVVASERSEREKEAARGRLRRSRRGGGGRSRRGGGGGWRRGREERVGAAPVALGAALCGLPATRRALIRRPEPPHPGRPLPPRRPRHAGPERAPPAPAGMAGMAGMAGAGAAGAGGRRGVGRSGTIPRAAGPRRGRGLKPPRWGLVRLGGPRPEVLPCPRQTGLGEGGGPGKPRVPPGGTRVELIIGRGRVHGPLLGFRTFTSFELQRPSRGSGGSPRNLRGPLIRPPRFMGVVPARFQFLGTLPWFVLLWKDNHVCS